MGRTGSEMKREYNFGTGQWLVIQSLEPMFVWTEILQQPRGTESKTLFASLIQCYDIV